MDSRPFGLPFVPPAHFRVFDSASSPVCLDWFLVLTLPSPLISVLPCIEFRTRPFFHPPYLMLHAPSSLFRSPSSRTPSLEPCFLALESTPPTSPILALFTWHGSLSTLVAVSYSTSALFLLGAVPPFAFACGGITFAAASVLSVK